jgi:hypothetical protein
MDKHLWFKAKKHGWGWTPVTWQGWLVILIYGIGLFLLSTQLSGAQYPLRYLTIIYLPSLVIWTGFLIIFCSITGEKPSWQWGAGRRSSPPESHAKQARTTQKKST